MAGTPTRDDVLRAQDELAELNRRHGFKRNEGGSPSPPAPDVDGHDEPAASPARDTPAEDPGPPRFLAVSLEQKVAQLSGGGLVPLDDTETHAIANILLTALKRSMAVAFSRVAESHGAAGQTELFVDQPVNPPDGTP